MSQTVDRVPASMPLVKAADHSADHNPRQQHQRTTPDEETTSNGEASLAPISNEDEPAVVLDTGSHPATPLGGVAAYQAAARHAIEALGRDPLQDHEPDETVLWGLGPDDS